MEVIAIVEMILLFFLYFHTIKGYKEICDKKDWYIETLEDEIDKLRDYIRRSEE